MKISPHALNRGLEVWFLGLRGWGPGSSSFKDLSRNGRDATLVNWDVGDWEAMPLTGGEIAYRCDGTGEYAEVTDYKGVLGTSACTAMMWYRTTASGAGVFSWGANSNYARVSLGIESGVLWNRYWNATASGGSGLNDGEWHHVAYTFPSGGQCQDSRYYIDGAELSMSYGSPTASINITSGSSLRVGYGLHLSVTSLQGTLNDFRLFNREFPPLEIFEAYVDSLRGYPKTLTRHRPAILSVPAVGGGFQSAWAINRTSVLSYA